MLARVPKQRVRERDAYEFFVRTEPDGNVIWSHGIADRGAVLRHPGAVCRSHITYHPSLKRYLLTMTGPGSEPRFEGSLGTYDAPEPGGPMDNCLLYGRLGRWAGPLGLVCFQMVQRRRAHGLARVFRRWQFFRLARHVGTGGGLANDTDSGQPRGQRLTTARFLPHYSIPGINGIGAN